MAVEYARAKQETVSALKVLEKLSAGRGNQVLAAYLEEQQQKLVKDRFHLVVLGQFKRGKTTFLNALLGDEVLPTGVVPLTSIVTLIEYAEQMQITIYFENGATKPITPQELPEYVTEEGNPGNSKNVRHVTLAYPSAYLKDGVLLIDTPGVGSIYKNNTDETYKYLPMVDAAIFLLSSDQPISEAECEFLTKISRYSAKTFFILNKIDYLKGSDREKALDFTKKTLAEQLGYHRVQVYPLSAKLALEGKITGDRVKLQNSLLPRFEQELQHFLMREKGQTVLAAAITKGINASGELKLNLELELKALGIPLQDLKKKVELFDQMVRQLEQQQLDNSYLLKGEVDRLLAAMEQEITRFRATRRELIEAQVNRACRECGLGGRLLIGHLENMIYNAVEKNLKEWYPELDQKVSQGFDDLVQRFTGKTNEIVEELLKHSASIFEISLEGFTKVERLTSESKLYYILGDEPGLLLPDPIQITAAVLPRFISGPIILREMTAKVDKELDRNCGRVRYDMRERVEKSVRLFARALEEKFQAVVSQTRAVLERALAQKESGEKHTGAAAAEIQKQLLIVEQVKKDLVNLQSLIKLDESAGGRIIPIERRCEA
ncbi:dynamin family protein [Desulfotruncus alcoholivorax]|uniref:dynamin family protein n=1 Tax=Desulfotruncus alcoholivorax TaxID=265477 RepID=UPI0004086A71|nr:dynamin family protein [Desulfotruncus alcoholivorax]